MGKSYDLGPRIGIDGEADFRKSILNIQATITTLGVEMESVSKKYDKNDKSVENLTSQNKLLNKQIDKQKEALVVLNKGLKYAEENYGANDKRTQEWKQSVLRAEMKLREMEDAVKANNSALTDNINNTRKAKKNTDDLGDSSEKAGGKIKNILKHLASGTWKVALTSIKAIGAALAAAAAGMVRLTESTKEYRLDLSKLEQNTKNANLDFEKMKGHLSELTALTGEMDSSVEAVSDLMAIGFNESQMADVVNALAGAVVKFPDTLKIEGLADGLQETLATGKSVGPFAELIERLGGDLEEFDAQLAGATTEAEKQQVALDFLSKNGLADIYSGYQEANESMLAAAEAQQKLDDALANVASAVEPAVANLKSGAADVLASITGMVTGVEGAEVDFESSISNLVGGVVNQLQSMLPIISSVALAIAPTLINGIIQAAPQLIGTAVLLLNTIVTGILDNLQLITESALSLVMMLVNNILENLPLVIDGALQLVVALALGIAEALPVLIPTVIQTILTITQGLIDNLPLIIEAAIQLVTGLMLGIINALPLIMEQAPVLIETLIEGLVAAIPLLVNASISIIKGLADFFTNGENIAMLVTSSTEVILAIAAGLVSAIPDLILAIPQIVKAINDSFMETDWLQLGRDILSGIGEGIKEAAGNLTQAAQDAALSALDGVKDLLDIHSPSGVTRDEIGLMMGYGIAEGLIDSGDQIQAALGEVTRKVQIDADYTGAAGSVNDYTYDYSQRIEQNVNVNGANELEWERRMNAMVARQFEMMIRNI